MKLVTFVEQGDAPPVGALDGEAVVDLSAAFVDMLALIDGGEPALAEARRLLRARGRVVARAGLGERGKDITEPAALEHVFGYTLFNDMSARDLHCAEIAASLGPVKGKDFDGSNVLGPCIVTRDELTDPYAIDIEARVDGELWTRSSTRSMLHRWERVIAHVSRSETRNPGELIGSGTVDGGCGREQERYLRAGARVDITASGIGPLSCRLVRS